MAAHRFHPRRVGRIEIEQDVARIPVFGIRMNVDVTSLPIAQAEEADGGCTHQLGGGPQPFSRERSARGVVNQTDQIKRVRHGRRMAANSLPGKKETPVRHVTMLRLKGIGYNLCLANGNCVFSSVSHRRGSPHVPRLIEFISGYVVLMPGDIITTGCPKAAGAISPGDEMSLEIETIGILRNPVVAGTEPCPA